MKMREKITKRSKKKRYSKIKEIK